MASSDFTTKICSKCSRELSADTRHFYRDKQKRDGLSSSCRECHGSSFGLLNPSDGYKRCNLCLDVFPKTAEHFHFSPSRQKFRHICITCERDVERERMRKWRASHPEEAKAKGRHDQKIYRKNNPDKARIRRKNGTQRRLRESPEHERQKQKEKYLRRKVRDNDGLRAKGIRNNHRRRERKRANTTDEHFSSRDVETHFKTQNGKCWWCGKSLGDGYQIDHRISLARGGSNAANNICLSCADCNRRKNDKMPWEWNGRLL